MLRRGFKSEANRYAREFRLELGVPRMGLCALGNLQNTY